MDKFANFSLLSGLATPLYHQVHDLVYWKLLLPAFLLALVIAYFKAPWGTPEFASCLKRLVITVLLLVAFPEIQDAIIQVTSYIAKTIAGGETDFLSDFFKTGSAAAKQAVERGSLLNFPSLIISIISFIAWCIVYIATYFILAVRHFMWITMTVLAPILILCNIFPATANITKGLFKSLIELGSWEIYWRILEKILKTLGYAEMAGVGDVFLTIVINIVVALAMISTPSIIKSIVGGGITSAAGMLQALSFGTAMTIPAKAAVTFGTLKSVGGAAIQAMQLPKRAYQGAKNYFTPQMQGKRKTPHHFKRP